MFNEKYSKFLKFSIFFVVQVRFELTVAEVRSDLPSLFIPRLLSPIHKGFFCTIVGLTGFEPITEGPKSSVLLYYTKAQYYRETFHCQPRLTNNHFY